MVSAILYNSRLQVAVWCLSAAGCLCTVYVNMVVSFVIQISYFMVGRREGMRRIASRH